ncbi:hypothetical protein [Limosilactobacillus coleohominis]|uniref:hypothetical protein n=1 Tax=Limosilactobacillus coleohominis TaxID=181675 RepID=UPI002A91DE0B|nr:hypothetical protein [Limosilactobacillus coleohominis]MDY5628901.1 hypothetical protein [Limosilactobacillus coleohominis]
MALKRMFNNSVIQSDEFTDLSNDAKLAYFYFGMYADDCGFVDNSKTIFYILGIAKEYDQVITELIETEFIIPIDDKKLLLIRHWNANNYISRYRAKSRYMKQKLEGICLDDGGVYNQDNDGEPAVNYFTKTADNKVSTLSDKKKRELYGI